MTMFIFLGDMAVIAFMVGLAIWFTSKSDDEALEEAARIPLEDENYHG